MEVYNIISPSKMCHNLRLNQLTMRGFYLLQRSHTMPQAFSKPSKTDEGGQNGHNQQGHEEGLGL